MTVGTEYEVASLDALDPDSGWLRLDRVPDAIRRTLAISGRHHERLRLEP